MKIDESLINHNLAKIATDCTDHFYDFICDGNFDEQNKMIAVVALAKLEGAVDLANELKRVLKE